MFQKTKRIREILSLKYSNLKNSGISPQYLRKLDNEGLSSSIKKFFELSEKTNIEPKALFDMLKNQETENH
jgi:hypothetical protein